MKNKITLALVFLTSTLMAQFDVTFQVDMNDYSGSFTTPEVNGTFNSWCGDCAAMTDADADGVWDITISLAAGSYEFNLHCNCR